MSPAVHEGQGLYKHDNDGIGACAGSAGLDLLGGLGGLDLGGPAGPAPGPPPPAQQAPAAFADPFAAPPPPFAAAAPPPAPPMPVLLPADKGKGLALSGQVMRANGGPGAMHC